MSNEGLRNPIREPYSEGWDAVENKNHNNRLLYQGCEAFWRDVKYAVMARNYRFVKELSTELRAASRRETHRERVAALQSWLLRLKQIEAFPMPESALRNTAYHLLGYWKDSLDAVDRQALAALSVSDPIAVIDTLRLRLEALPAPYLQTSYIWRGASWDEARFQHRGTWYQFRVDARGALKHSDAAFVEMTVTVVGDTSDVCIGAPGPL